MKKDNNFFGKMQLGFACVGIKFPIFIKHIHMLLQIYKTKTPLKSMHYLVALLYIIKFLNYFLKKSLLFYMGKRFFFFNKENPDFLYGKENNCICIFIYMSDQKRTCPNTNPWNVDSSSSSTNASRGNILLFFSALILLLDYHKMDFRGKKKKVEPFIYIF